MKILKYVVIFLLLAIPVWAVEGAILKVTLSADQMTGFISLFSANN